MVKFFNSDESGIEGVAGAVAQGAKAVAQSVGGQVGPTSQDIANHLYGASDQKQDQQSEEQGTEALGQMQGKGKAVQKANTNARSNRASKPVSVWGMLGLDYGAEKPLDPNDPSVKRRQEMAAAGKTPEEIEEYEKLKKLLHDEQVKDLLSPQKKQKEETPYEKKLREEEEKKKEKNVKEQEEVKKKEDLAVVMKRTSAENKAWGAG